MYTGLKHLHSYWAYVALALLAIAAIYFLFKLITGKSITAGDRKLSLFAMVALHLQFVFGLVLYFIAPVVKSAMVDFGGAMKDEALRFSALEHPLMMLLAVILATVANSKVKKAIAISGKATVPAILFLLSLLFVLSRIPWNVWPGF